MLETLVIDCSEAAKWAWPESGDAEALRLLDRQESGEVSLIAPDLPPTEFAGLIAKRTRKKQISPAEAYQAFLLLEQSELRLFATRPLLGQALQLALRHQMSLWDCVYLALAAEHDCPLITADRRQWDFRRCNWAPGYQSTRLLHHQLLDVPRSGGLAVDGST